MNAWHQHNNPPFQQIQLTDNQHYNPDDSSRLFRQSCFRHMLFLTSIYLFIFWSWETWSRTNIGKTMFEQTAERTEKSNKCFRSGEYIRLGHETIQASTRRSSWFKNHPRAEPAAPAQVWGGVGGRVWGISTTQGGNDQTGNKPWRMSVMPMHRYILLTFM